MRFRLNVPRAASLVACAWLLVPAWCQTQYVITTVAGGSIPPTPAAPLATSLGNPAGIAEDASGNRYFTSDNVVFEVSPAGLLTRFAGTSLMTGYYGDNGPATSAGFAAPNSVAVDSLGNVYIADANEARIRKVSVNGIISTVAGNGNFGYAGDGGPATSAEFSYIQGVAVDSIGNVYIADTYNNRIREVSAETGTITTVAGNGAFGYSGDTGPATSAELANPFALAIDSSGDIFIADTSNCRVREVSASDGVISTVAGTGTCGYSGDTGPATSAELAQMGDVVVDSTGNIYVADTPNYRIREFTVGGNISTIAGTGFDGYSGDGGLATSAQISFLERIAVDSSGNVTLADTYNGRIRTFSVGGSISTIAGNESGGYFGDGGPAANAGLGYPYGVAADVSGNLYILDSDDERVREVALNGTITTIAGNGNPGYSGDNGPATSAELGYPQGIAVDSASPPNIYIADSYNARVRKIAPNGTITTVAGNGNYGFSGDTGPATGAELNFPTAVALDSLGNLYIADTNNERIRMVALNGTITTVAGNGTAGYSGDGILAVDAELNYPNGVAVDSTGNIYIVDTFNNRIRMVATNGNISTVAGNGTAGYSGDGNLATLAELNTPAGALAVNSTGVYFTDTYNNWVQHFTVGGNIDIIAGKGFADYFGDHGAATNAAVNYPRGVFVNASGDVFVTDTANSAIRELVPESTAPSLSITSAHTGNFSAGQTSADYTIQVNNSVLTGPTSGTATVTELVPAGLSLVSMSGSGWNCSSNTCTITQALGAGAGYPVISVVVDVAADAPASLVNQVSVTGAGSFPAAADDLTNVTCVTPSPSSLTVDSTGGGAQALNLAAATSSCNWSAATNFGNWLSVSPSSGTGNGTPNVNISTNATGADRSGVIAFGPSTVSVTERSTATVFADTPPSNYDFDAVNLLSTEGITNGCSAVPLDFCPLEEIIRSQMAVFMVRAVLHTDDFPYSPTPYFTDVPVGSFGFQWIQKMYELGITNGCGGVPGDLQYCPNDQVTRAQMAVFLIRMRYGSSYNFDYPSVPYFTDVTPTTFGWSWIQRMKEDNITSGCTVTTYCPNNSVTRGDMATFVMRGAFNELLPPGEPVLVSISPTTIVHGASPVTYTITGLNTNFVQGVTTLGTLAGITAGAVTVVNETTLTVQLSAASDAALEPVSPLAITGTPPGNQEAVLPNGLTVQ